MSFGVFSIPSRKFVGSHSLSTDGRYVVGWKPHGSRALMLKDETLGWEMEFKDVAGAVVSNHGVALLSEWVDPDNDAGRLWALWPDGRVVMKAEIPGSPTSIGIDIQGELACCYAAHHTMVGRTRALDATLFVFSLATASLLFRSNVWAPMIERIERDGAAIVIVTKAHTYRFNEAGGLLGKESPGPSMFPRHP